MKHAVLIRTWGLSILLFFAWGSRPFAQAPPPSYIYKILGERHLQLAAHYPPDWKKEDKRPAVLLFSGGHKVMADASGNLPPLAAERARRGLPVVNAGPEGPGALHKPLAEHFTRQGLVCFRVEYRTRGKDGVLPGEDLLDAVEAMRWVRRNAATLGIDPERVAAAGCSSGGYLAAGLFALEDLAPPDTGSPPISARPSALLLFSPLLDWLRVGSMTDAFLVVLGGDKELGARLSPIRHWRKDMPPTLILEGTEEPPFATVKEFADQWIAQGAPLEIFIAPGGVHGFFGKPEWVDKANARADEFLRKLGYLQDQPQGISSASPRTAQAERTQGRTKAGRKSKDTSSRLAAMLGKFPEADTNKNGVLTMEEAQAYRGGMKQPKAAVKPPDAESGAAAKDAGPPAASTLLPSRGWDANKDGKLGKEEFKAPAALFGNLDLDQDGFLSGAELAKLDRKLDPAKVDDANWVVPPEKDIHGLQHKTYHSASMKTDVGYNIYLPDEYPASGKRYPVIYHLHGAGGNESSQVNLAEVYHKAITQRTMCPVMIVFANGGKRSYYCDGASGKVMAETTIIKELLPHIDATYRTIPEKACRVIHGFSMGGFGALKFGTKYPDLFCAVLSFGGGMASPGSVHLDFLRHIVGDDARIIAENNPADLAVKNKDALRGMSLWLFTGTRDVAREDSTWAHEWLRSHGIAHRFEVSEDVGHAVNRHYDIFGDEIFQMLRQHFADSKAFVLAPAARITQGPSTAAVPSLDELANQLRAESLPSRVRAAFALLEMGAATKASSPALIEALTGDEALDHAVAGQILFLKPGSVENTARLAHATGQGAFACTVAAWELSRIGPPAAQEALPALIQALKSEDKHTRNFAAVALGVMGPDARQAIPALTATLQDTDSAETPQQNYRYPRAGAAFALEMMGSASLEKTSSTADLKTLSRMLFQESGRLRPGVAEGLSVLGAFAGAAPPVHKSAGRQAAPIHESVALALGYLDSLAKMPEPDEIARQEREGQLSDSSRRVILALGGVQQGIVPALQVSLKEAATDPRVAAIRQLAVLGPAAGEITPLLRAALRDRDWIVRYEAWYALRRIEAP